MCGALTNLNGFPGNMMDTIWYNRCILLHTKSEDAEYKNLVASIYVLFMYNILHITYILLLYMILYIE